MGIYDRGWYRNEGPSFLDSLANRGRVCWWLIAINVGVFIVQVLSRPAQDPWMRTLIDPDGPFTSAFILDVNKVMDGQVWRLLTYAFLHSTASLWHIAMNMLFLYLFGREIEDLYGAGEFLAFYLVAAVVGGVAFVHHANLAALPPGTQNLHGRAATVSAERLAHAIANRGTWLYQGGGSHEGANS